MALQLPHYRLMSPARCMVERGPAIAVSTIGAGLLFQQQPDQHTVASLRSHYQRRLAGASARIHLRVIGNEQAGRLETPAGGGLGQRRAAVVIGLVGLRLLE